jgi:hypothetical protein
MRPSNKIPGIIESYRGEPKTPFGVRLSHPPDGLLGGLKGYRLEVRSRKSGVLLFADEVATDLIGRLKQSAITAKGLKAMKAIP